MNLYNIREGTLELERKQIDFNNPIFRRLLCLKTNVSEKDLKYLIMPAVGDTITLGNVIYRISYIRENPFRFTAEPVGIIQEKEMEEKVIPQLEELSPKSDLVQPENAQGD
jgi:hypothetical protein